MNVLVVPMFALSRMGGPWSRAQAVAAAFRDAGHRVVLGMADDGNCANPCVPDIVQLPVPAPLGLPMAVSSRTFPLAERLGVSGRKPVRSFEEVLWLTGALAPKYELQSVSALCEVIEAYGIDAVYSEYSLPAIIASRALGVPVFGSFSYTTQASFACAPGKSKGLRKLLKEIELAEVDSALELFSWLEQRFVPSCHELEPIDDAKTEFAGFMREAPTLESAKRDCILVYLGAGSVPQRKVERVVAAALSDLGCDVFVAGCEKQRCEASVQFAPRFDFGELLPRACCFVHHGGQNSTMDALAYGVPQVVVPGRVFERVYNAQSVERAGAGVRLGSFDSGALRDACRRVIATPSFSDASLVIRQTLIECGGVDHIVSSVEKAVTETR